jgi:molecular chaperone DnaK
MIADAEHHRDEDRRLRELTDARNELDAAAYQVDQMLAQRGDAVPVHEKARAENLVADARRAVQEEQSVERIRGLTLELQQVYQALASAGPGPQGQPDAAARAGDDDDVIDAEFTTHE